MGDRLLTGGVTLPAFDAPLAAIWVRVVHQLKRETLARRVDTMVLPHVGQNYYSLQLVPRDGMPLRLMLNATARLVACSEDRDSPGLHLPGTPFRPVPRADLFTVAGFVVADPADLERPIASGDLADLHPGELRDVSYHGVTRLGDLLFNWFD